MFTVLVNFIASLFKEHEDVDFQLSKAWVEL